MSNLTAIVQKKLWSQNKISKHVSNLTVTVQNTIVVTFKVSEALTVSMKSNSSALVSCFFANPRFAKGRQSLKSHYSHLNCFLVSPCPDQYRLAIVPWERADTNLANLPKLPGLFFCILRWKLHSIPRKQKKITALTLLWHPKVHVQRQPYRATLRVDV